MPLLFLAADFWGTFAAFCGVGVVIVIAIIGAAGRLLLKLSDIDSGISDIRGDLKVNDLRYQNVHEAISDLKAGHTDHEERIGHLERIPAMAEFGSAMHTIVEAARDVTRAKGAGA